MAKKLKQKALAKRRPIFIHLKKYNYNYNYFGIAKRLFKIMTNYRTNCNANVKVLVLFTRRAKRSGDIILL